MDLSAASRFARELLVVHGLSDWSFRFDEARRRFGSCCHQDRSITLSRPLVLLNDESSVRATLVHEIAHALVGPEHGHDAVWQAKDRSLGGDGQRCYGAEVVSPLAPFLGVCPNCGRQESVFRRRRVACAKCCSAFAQGRFDARFALRYERNVQRQPGGIAVVRTLTVEQPAVPNAQSVGDLPPAQDDVLASALVFIRQWDAVVGDAAWHIGKKLRDVKKTVRHGAYATFVRDQLGYAPSTARLYTAIGMAPDGQQLAPLGLAKARELLRLSQELRAALLADRTTRTFRVRELRDRIDALCGPRTVRPTEPTPRPVVVAASDPSVEYAWAAGQFHLLPDKVTDQAIRERYVLLTALFDPANGHVPDQTFRDQLARAKGILEAALYARKAADLVVEAA